MLNTEKNYQNIARRLILIEHALRVKKKKYVKYFYILKIELFLINGTISFITNINFFKQINIELSTMGHLKIKFNENIKCIFFHLGVIDNRVKQGDIFYAK